MIPSAAAAKPPRVWMFAALTVVAAFFVALLLPENLFLSAPETDMIGQLAAWRAFAADNIGAGHLPLWNPYTYAGQPFLGDFQSAELYPLNVVFLFLPLARAVNFSFLLHLLILGWGMRYWAARRGYHPHAAALCGFIAALSGPVYLRLYAGHLSNLCTMAWVPWLFVALEIAWHSRSWRPLLLAAAAVCLQILGGHPQYVFYVAIAAGLHAVVYSIADPSIRRRALPMVAVVYLGGAALAAAQLLPGFAAAAEGVRQGKLDYNFVRMFSFAPENLLTLFAPGFFGDLANHENYWGRAFLWEESLFIGTTSLVLAALALCDHAYRRFVRADCVIIALLFLLALGESTPLLLFLYDYVPGFAMFRCLAKFIFPATLFGVLIVGAGADALIRRRPGPKVLAVSVLVLGGLALGASCFISLQPGCLAGLIRAVHQTHETYVPVEKLTDASFINHAELQAAQSLAQTGLLFILAGTALFLTHRWPAWRWVPLAVIPIEMLVFVQANLATSTTDILMPRPISDFIAAHPGDYRILNPVGRDNGYFMDKAAMWGDDPTVLKRYAEFIFFTQGANPDYVIQNQAFSALPRIFSILRMRYAFVPDPTDPTHYQIIQSPDSLPRALLVSNYQVLPGRDAIFTELLKPDFNPRQTVLLEKEPSPPPQASASAGSVKVTDSTTDSLTLEADTPTPALLLITDLYSRDWRALPLAGSSQTTYEILPADYVIRAIPLAAGHHHLLVEYAPPSFRLGVWISLISWAGWGGLMVVACRRSRLDPV